jgi:anti-sigma-K factor RskA
MACAEADELVGAYALDALPADEAASFRAHIAGCRDHAAMARELRATAAMLAETAEPLAPPAGLRARMLDAVAREPQVTTSAAQPLCLETARSAAATGATRPRRPWENVRPLQAWGALAAAIIAALAIWNVTLQSADDDDGGFDARQATSINAFQAHNVGGGGNALYFADEKTIVIVADGVDPLDSSRTYQLWAIDDEGDKGPVSLGIMRPDEAGHMSSTVRFDVPSSDLIAITIEPAGGSEAPTSSPVFTADLRS